MPHWAMWPHWFNWCQRLTSAQAQRPGPIHISKQVNHQIVHPSWQRIETLLKILANCLTLLGVAQKLLDPLKD